MGSDIRKTGIEIIGDVPWGAHFCQFYQTKQDLIDILVPYFKTGLENNEFCMWITAEPLQEAEAEAALRSALPDLDRYLAAGQIEIIPHTGWYLLEGMFNQQRVLDGWVTKLDAALKSGFEGLRLTGNTFWLEKDDWQDFTDYEEAVNSVIGNYRMMAICTYSLDKCGAGEIADVIANHEFAVMKRRGEWTMIESSTLHQSKQVLKTALDQLDARAEDLRNLNERLESSAAELEAANEELRAADDELRTEIEERTLAQDALSEGERRVRHKLDSILSPEGDLGNLELADILDVPAIQSLMDNFHDLARIPMAIIDLKGDVLVGVGWQDICLHFHRVNPETCKHCIESDTVLTQGVLPGESRLYKCKNNMWDIATPIMVGGEHVGNLFSGQFFFDDEPLDYDLFRSQAVKYGFNEEAYIAALNSVPRLSRAALDNAMSFFVKLSNMLSKLSYSNIMLARSLSERDALTKSLRQSEKRLNRSQEIAHLGSWELDLADNRLTWSDEVYRIFGLQPQEFAATYEAFLDAVHPEDRAAVDAAYSSSLREGRSSYEIEHRVVSKPNGEIRWVHEKCEHVRDQDGRIIRSIGMVLDITERKRAEEQRLRQAEELGQANEELQAQSEELESANHELTVANEELATVNNQLQEANRALELVNEVAEDFLAGTSLEHSLQSVLGTAKFLTAASSALIAIYEQPDVLKTWVCDLGGAQCEIEPLLAIGGAYPHLAASYSEGLVIKNSNSGMSPHPNHIPLHNVLSLSMQVKGGWAHLVLANKDHDFTEDDALKAQVLGRLTSIIIDRAELDRSERDARAEAELLYRREHHIAEMLQQALIPPYVTSNLDGYEIAVEYQPALKEAEIGGDFYDVFDLGDDKLGILIGDVAGKGLLAAMRVAAARYAIRSYAFLDSNPGSVLTLANNALSKDEVENGGMLTAFFAVVNVQDRTMVYSSSGHEPALLRRADGSIKELTVPGRPLGIYEGYDYPEAHQDLLPGDTVVMITDGITEARPGGIDLFGQEGVFSYLSTSRATCLKEIASGLLSAAVNHAGGNLQDDAAIVVFELRDRAKD